MLEFPSLPWLAPDCQAAEDDLVELVAEVREDVAADGEEAN